MKIAQISFLHSMLISISLLISSVLISLSIFSLSSNVQTALASNVSVAKANTPLTQITTSPNPNITTVSVGSLQSRGSTNAKVGIIEYSDFECPYCNLYFDNAGRQINSSYVETSKVQLFYRNMPLSIHSHARELAQASVCASNQNKFWKYYDTTFQTVLDNKRVVSDNLIQDVSQKIGINNNDFNKCLKDKATSDSVDADLQDSQKNGFSGTPTFVIGKIENGQIKNGSIITGAQAFTDFQKIIDSYI